jgi:hypothetical protein
MSENARLTGNVGQIEVGFVEREATKPDPLRR